jgi:hypothetical protein
MNCDLCGALAGATAVVKVLGGCSNDAVFGMSPDDDDDDGGGGIAPSLLVKYCWALAVVLL